MPINKMQFNQKGRTRHSMERIMLIDQILVRHKRIPTREEFRNKVNKNLPFDAQISAETLDKDIAYLRNHIELRNLEEGTDFSLKFSKDRGYHYSEPGYSYFTNAVNESDKNLLMLANSIFNVFKGTALQDKFSEVVNKVLAESLTGGPVHGLAHINSVQIGGPMPPAGNKWIALLLEAIYEKQAMEMRYKGHGKPEKKKIICPYVLKQFQDRWYMVAYDYNCERKHKTSVFILDGIKSLEISNKPYFIDPFFNPEDYFRYSIGVWHWHEKEPVTVKLEFNAHIDMVQSNPLHHSQKSFPSKDGRKLTVEIFVYESPELEMLILTFGSAVKVITPSSLAERVKLQAIKMLELYTQ